MHKELLLLRHGKSDWNTHKTDFYRPLKKRGRINAKQMGKWLIYKDLLPEIIISSPATRAMKTAELACKAMGCSAQIIKAEASLYLAGEADFLHILANIPEQLRRVMLVGHNPGLEDLLLHLVPTIPVPADGKLFPTASIAYLQLNSNWTSLSGSYFTQRPKDL